MTDTGQKAPRPKYKAIAADWSKLASDYSADCDRLRGQLDTTRNKFAVLTAEYERLNTWFVRWMGAALLEAAILVTLLIARYAR